MLWYKSRKPAQMERKPFLCDAAIRHLGEIVKAHFEILEFGAGGSTLWLAQRCANITSVENNKDWYESVKKAAPDNVTLILDEAAKMPSGIFDLIYIDGDPPELRREWITNAPLRLSRHGWLVLDNANRPEYEIERNWLKSIAGVVMTIDGNEVNTKYLVTEFYQFR